MLMPHAWKLNKSKLFRTIIKGLCQQVFLFCVCILFVSRLYFYMSQLCYSFVFTKVLTEKFNFKVPFLIVFEYI